MVSKKTKHLRKRNKRVLAQNLKDGLDEKSDETNLYRSSKVFKEMVPNKHSSTAYVRKEKTPKEPMLSDSTKKGSPSINIGKMD